MTKRKESAATSTDDDKPRPTAKKSVPALIVLIISASGRRYHNGILRDVLRLYEKMAILV